MSRFYNHLNLATVPLGNLGIDPPEKIPEPIWIDIHPLEYESLFGLFSDFEKRCREHPIDVHFTQDDFDRQEKDMKRIYNEMFAKSLEQDANKPIPTP